MTASNAQPQHDDGSQGERPAAIQLRRRFGISTRLILKHCFALIVAYIIVIVVITTFDRLVKRGVVTFNTEVPYFMFTLVFLISTAVLACKVLYEVVYYLMYDYKFVHEQLIITKGVLWRTTASFPVTKMTDIYIERTPLDLICFLATLQVTTPAAVTNFGGIEGLPPGSAARLQSFLVGLINSTQPQADPAYAEHVAEETPQLDVPEKSSTAEKE